MKTTLCKLLAYGCALAPFALHAQNQITETRDVLDKWVETRQLISEERSDWKT